ncbi:MAG: hypothetical protein WCT04_07675 [Planctomycetota bacterium]
MNEINNNAGEGQSDKTAVTAELPGVFAQIGALPSGALVTEDGLASIMGKCKASIKAAVIRGELPRPSRLMGKNTWTAGAIIRHHESRLEAEAKRFRFKP